MTWNFARTLFLVWLATTGLSACANVSEEGGRSPLLANQSSASGSQSPLARLGAALTGRNGDTRRLGNDELIGRSQHADRPLIATSDTGEFSLNLIDVPIAEAAAAVLGEALERNFTVSPELTGSVTLQTTMPLTDRELLDTFSTVLAINSAALVVEGDLITVLPANSVPQNLAVFDRGSEQPVDARLIAVPLQYIGSDEMTRLLQPIVGSSVRVQSVPNRNILLLSGSRGEIVAAVDAVNLFDIDVLRGKSVALVQLHAAAPSAVVEELNTVFETGPGGSLEGVLEFLPSERLGAVLVVTSRAQYLSEAEQWIRDLDRAAGGVQRRPVVYALQNRDASELAPVLVQMLGETSTDEGSPLPGQPRVVADATNNSIVVWGNDTEQQSFARLIQSLDTTPVQVLLEATIAEVALNDQLDFGLRWFFENGDLRSTFSDATNGAVSSNFPGLSFTFQGTSAAVAINALSSVTDVNVVSSPSLVVIDNQEARLQIGDQVPVATQQVRDVSDPDAPIVNTISFRDTGIILDVRPRVSESGRVVLEITQEVSSVSTTSTSGIDSPTISQRRIETSVALFDGETIALGGLIEESQNRTNSQVPAVGEIPVLGALFRSRSDRVRRTELLVLITPRVIRNGVEARAATEELRQRISDSDALVEQGVPNNTVGHRIFQ